MARIQAPHTAQLGVVEAPGPGGGRREERLQSAETCENDERPRIMPYWVPSLPDDIA